MRTSTAVVITFALAIGFGSGASLAADARVALDGDAKLAMTAPDEWKVDEDPGAPARTLRFQPAKGDAFYILVTPLTKAAGGAGFEPEHLRDYVELDKVQLATQAVEKDIPVLELKSATAHGFYFSATDRAPKAGEYTYLTRGVMLVGDVPVTFSIFSNGDGKSVSTTALAMLAAAHLE